MDYSLSKDFPLMPEQNEMIDFAIRRPYAIISGQTGLGKSYTAVTLAAQLMLQNKDLFTVIIAPPKALLGFQKELNEKLHVSYSIISTEETVNNPKARILLLSNTCLDKALLTIVELKKRFKLLGIYDESHCLMNPSSKMYKEFMQIRNMFCVLYFLTATSCKNNIEGMYHMITLLNPRILGSWSNFKNKYLVMNKKKINQTLKNRKKVTRTIEEIVGYKNLEELQRILNMLIIVRQKQYNLKFTYHSEKLTPEEAAKYLEASAGNHSENATDFWSVRLRDITFVVDNINSPVDSKTLTTKEKLFLKVFRQNLIDGKPTIVYCEYIEVLNRLEYLLNCYKRDLGLSEILIIKGGISMDKRKKIQDQIAIDKPLLITSAGGESINLQRANAIIFYDLPYDIAKIMQVIGRITRVDTKYSEQYIDVIEAFGTTDTYKRLCMEKNQKLVESLFGKMNTLPMSTYNNEQKFMRTLKNSLLWTFKSGKIISEAELENIFARFNTDYE